MYISLPLFCTLASTVVGVCLPDAISDQQVLAGSQCTVSFVYCGRTLLNQHGIAISTLIAPKTRLTRKWCAGFAKEKLLEAIEAKRDHPIYALEYPEGCVFTCNKHNAITFEEYCEAGCKHTADGHDRCHRVKFYPKSSS